jgi:hypothetical protein
MLKKLVATVKRVKRLTKRKATTTSKDVDTEASTQSLAGDSQLNAPD